MDILFINYIYLFQRKLDCLIIICYRKRYIYWKYFLKFNKNNDIIDENIEKEDGEKKSKIFCGRIEEKLKFSTNNKQKY